MGRFYEIALSANGSPPNTPPIVAWSSYPGGKFDPAALNVQLDLLSSNLAQPLGNSTVTIDGIDLKTLQQSQQYFGMQIRVKGGMGANGLPLANPKQAGLLVQGLVFQSFGNWIGSDMNLNFVIVAGSKSYTFANPGNLVFDWKEGQPLSAALLATLTTAFPGITPTIIIGQYPWTEPIRHYTATLSQFAQWLKSHTKSATSGGVEIAVQSNGTILVYDGAYRPDAVKLDFTDLVGQPKWVDQNVMQFATVMRADIQVGSQVKFPPGMTGLAGFVTTTANAFPSQLKYKTAFQGNFLITSVRHIGNLRDSDGASWATIFQAVPQNVG